MNSGDDTEKRRARTSRPLRNGKLEKAKEKDRSKTIAISYRQKSCLEFLIPRFVSPRLLRYLPQGRNTNKNRILWQENLSIVSSIPSAGH